MERAVLIGNGEAIASHHLLLDASEPEGDNSDAFRIKAGETVREMEKKLIFRTLEDVKDNRTQAAELLGISIRTLRNKLKEYRDETTTG
jgi:DNA-binding NtrC family response regulator